MTSEVLLLAEVTACVLWVCLEGGGVGTITGQGECCCECQIRAGAATAAG